MMEHVMSGKPTSKLIRMGNVLFLSTIKGTKVTTRPTTPHELQQMECCRDNAVDSVNGSDAFSARNQFCWVKMENPSQI